MIFSKANLVVAEAAGKKSYTTVFLGKSGTSVATDGSILMAVGPIPRKVLSEVTIPYEKLEPLAPKENVYMPAQVIKEAVKQTPSTTRRLQNIVVVVEPDSGGLGLSTVNEAGEVKTVVGYALPNAYFPKEWRKAVAKRYSAKESVTFCVSRSALEKALKLVNKACPGVKGYDPVFVTASKEGIVLRSVNPVTLQRVIVALSTYSVEKELPLSRWEKWVLKGE